MNTRINNIFTSALTITFITILIHLTSCDTTEPNKPLLELQFEDASSTEAWITLKTNNLQIPTNVFLFVNEKLRTTIKLISLDTTIYIDSLLPNKTYNVNVMSNNFLVTSNKIQITTMDTTSHNFTWQTFEFGGEAGSSTLYDVAIIDENNIWAVGEIYMNDSLGNPDPNAYNAVHWDGSEWEVRRIMFYIDQDQPTNGMLSSSCQSTFLFKDNTIAITSNVQTYILNPNGSSKIIKMGFEWKDRFTINKLWGTSSSDLYAVGNGGNIAHYNGISWQKIESGTETFISDIWGIKNNKKIVYCTVSSLFIQPGKNDIKILKIRETNKVEEVNWEVNRLVNTIWTSNDLVKYVGGDGLFVNKTGKWEEIKLPTIYSTSHIRGTGLNNIVVVGSFGLTAHFNGNNWKIFDELYLANGYYSKAAIKDKKVAMVGSSGNNGIIVIGTQNN